MYDLFEKTWALESGRQDIYLDSITYWLCDLRKVI